MSLCNIFQDFFKKFWRTCPFLGPFVGPLIPLFWTSGDISSFGFQSQSGQPYSHLVEACMLHVPWDSPLVWHLPTSWQPAWQPNWSLLHRSTCEQALVGLTTGTYCTADKCSTDWAMLAQLISSLLKSKILFVYFQRFHALQAIHRAIKVMRKG